MGLAPQNDRDHSKFAKYLYAVGKKMIRNDRTMAKLKGCLFWTDSDYTVL
jgi:hypothetical protein